MRIIDCKAIAAQVLNDATVEKLKDRVLHVVMKNQNPDNLSYLKSIYRTARKYGVTVPTYTLPDDCPTCAKVDAVLGEKPLPKNEKVLFLGFKDDELTELVRDSKAIDDLMQVLDNPLCHCAVWAAIMTLDRVLGNDMERPHRTTVIGRSELAMDCGRELLMHNHTVTFCHTSTEDLESYLRASDVIVSFAGSPNLITSDMVKDGAIIISVGCAVAGGVLCGDVDMDSMKNKNVLVTAPTGGIGALTTALLFVDLAE